jgi:hypothetical protein
MRSSSWKRLAWRRSAPAADRRGRAGAGLSQRRGGRGRFAGLRAEEEPGGAALPPVTGASASAGGGGSAWGRTIDRGPQLRRDRSRDGHHVGGLELVAEYEGEGHDLPGGGRGQGMGVRACVCVHTCVGVGVCMLEGPANSVGRRAMLAPAARGSLTAPTRCAGAHLHRRAEPARRRGRGGRERVALERRRAAARLARDPHAEQRRDVALGGGLTGSTNRNRMRPAPVGQQGGLAPPPAAAQSNRAICPLQAASSAPPPAWRQRSTPGRPRRAPPRAACAASARRRTRGCRGRRRLGWGGGGGHEGVWGSDCDWDRHGARGAAAAAASRSLGARRPPAPPATSCFSSSAWWTPILRL